MALHDRKDLILELLRNYSRFVTVEQLSEKLFVSPATIRRDLAELEETKLVQRTRGGAILLESISTEAPMVLRENRNEMQKQIIATIAKDYIKDGMTIFMDSSSTAFMLARNLERFVNLQVITNNLKICWLLSGRKGIGLVCTGGRLKEQSMSFFGMSTVQFINGVNADAAFISAVGFSFENGSSDASEEDYYLKRAYLSNSKKKYLLVDTSKQDKEFLYRTAPLSAFNRVITESKDVNERLLRFVTVAS
ncbi:MAG: DeoR/GlpR family DNA-binding transcription regulator [Clostridiales Family XIII bacterium]|jgi:DeoR/GlpR family transcriptional regulator of sugar metabolism|nr:DeoR/GlpR family DNA-binding transcription regulator [Clostridiales Family XIII bacterium]